MEARKGNKMGSPLSRSTDTSTDDVLIDADSVVGDITASQNEIRDKFKELHDVIGVQQRNVDNLNKLVVDQFKKRQNDVYAWRKTGSNHVCEDPEEIKKLKETVKNLKSTLAQQENELKIQKQTSERERKEYKKEIDRLNSANSILLRDKRQFEEERRSNLYTIQELGKKVQLAEEHVRLAKQKKVRVALYTGNHGTVMDASAELTKMLRFHWEALGIQATVESCPDPRGHTGTTPLIILCINASRLGTDVSNATQNIHCDQSVAVVILHHKEIHALPSQASEKLLVGTQYRQLGAIVDIAFLKTKGLYTCDMNEKALDRLTAFISNFVQQG